MINYHPTDQRCQPDYVDVFKRRHEIFTRARFARPLSTAEAVADWVYWRPRKGEP